MADTIDLNLAEEIDTLVSLFRLRTSSRRFSERQMQLLFRDLPRLTERDLIEDHQQHDAVCPVCFNTFLAILAEEEHARAMDSPAHPVETLGVTRLNRTCGHLFCRKDIMRWVSDGHDSCPSCRRPLLTEADRRESVDGWPRDPIYAPPVHPTAALSSRTGGSGSDRENQRHGFSSMYS